MLRPRADNLSPGSYTQPLQQQNYLKILVPLPLAIRLFKQWDPKELEFLQDSEAGEREKDKALPDASQNLSHSSDNLSNHRAGQTGVELFIVVRDHSLT